MDGSRLFPRYENRSAGLGPLRNQLQFASSQIRPPMRVSLLLPLSLLVLTAATSAGWTAENASLHAALRSITSGELRDHVDVLADDSFEGREAGSRGGQAASGYLRSHFEKRGLTGAGADQSFFQMFGAGYRNVLGYVQGSDPELQHEYVLVGAHYDHVGYGNRANSFGPFGYVHNGADDNASGVAGVLEVLDALLTLPERPKRSVLFALWDGEEKGLLGSKHWVSTPTIPLEDVVFAFNVDMIGRLRKHLEVYGSRSVLGLRRRLAETNSHTNLPLDFSWEMKSNSDHYPFYSARIPVLMFHTGLHDDYHRPSDDAHLLNTDGMQGVARFMFNALYEIANQPERPVFRVDSELETPGERQHLEAPLSPPPPRLGVRWDPPEEGEFGLRLTDVGLDSAADRAGLQVGDRILKFAGQPVNDSVAFRKIVLNSGSPVMLSVARDGEEEPLEILVELTGKPTRIGISWRDDDGEPGTVILTRIIPGSPAGKAGLQVRDRIYEIAGQPFQDTEELLRLLTTLPGPIDLLIERDGQLQTVNLEVPDASS